MFEWHRNLIGVSRLALTLVVAPLLWVATNTACAGPESRLWDKWNTFDAESSIEVNHHTWQRLVHKYVSTDQSGLNRFNYNAVSPADRRALGYYLHQMGKIEVAKLNRDEQLAYWVNVYNAITVSVILEEYPVANILEIGGDIFTRGPWKDKLFTVDDTEITLWNITHHILRPIWKDVRVLYLLSCGAVSCPNIGENAYTGKTINGQLEAAALSYINGPAAVLTINGSSARISSMYYWYKEDFKYNGDYETNILNHLKGYATGELATSLEKVGHINGYDFDWTLNDTE